MGLAKRVEEALAAGRKAVEIEEENRARTSPGVAIAAFGSAWDTDPDCSLLVSLAEQRKETARVLITSSTNLDLYRIEGLVTEFIPASPDMGTRETLYCAQKISVFAQKWNFQSVVPSDAVSALILQDLDIDL